MLFLPPQEEDSHSSPAPPCDPSHRQQSSINFYNMSPSHELHFFTNSSMGPFHRMQSLKNRLLKHGSTVGSKVLPADLLQCGLLFPWFHRFFQEPAPVWVSNRIAAASGMHLLWDLLHAPPCTSMGCRGTDTSPWSAPHTSGESLAPRTLPTLPSSVIWGSTVVPLPRSHCSLSAVVAIVQVFVCS